MRSQAMGCRLDSANLCVRQLSLVPRTRWSSLGLWWFDKGRRFHTQRVGEFAHEVEQEL